MNARSFLLVSLASGLCGVAALPARAGRVPDPPPPISVGVTLTPPKPPEEAPAWTPPTSPAPMPAPAVRQRTRAELEKLVSPIALHPDPLIASILTASTYPLEIVQAARFVANTNNLSQLDAQPWDANVRTVAKMPPLIEMMNRDIVWTAQLGHAFVEQPMDVMQAIQDRRAQAQAAGTLKTTPQQVVTTTNAIVERTYEGQVIYVTNSVIQVQPASPEVVYVPAYDPALVYAYAPGEVVAASFVTFGVGLAFGAAFWGHCDWYYGGCYWGSYAPCAPACPPAYYCNNYNYNNSANAAVVKPGGQPLNQAPIPPRPIGNPNAVGAAGAAGPQSSISRPSGVQAAGTSVNGASTPQRWQPDPVRYSGGKPTASTVSAVSPSGASPYRSAPGKIGTPGGVAPAPSSFSTRPSAYTSGVRSAPQPVASASRSTANVRPSMASAAGTSNFRAPSASSVKGIGSAGGFSRPVSQGTSSFKGVSSGSSVGRSMGSGGGGFSRGASSASRGISRAR